jgi:Zn-dependent peptidase ImmA (M78 family)
LNIPESVKILGLIYKVEQVECIDVKNEDTVGQADHNNLVIKLKSSLSSTQKENTLIHEIVHSILESLGDHELSDDEKFVYRFSSVLHQVLKDNESLFT